MINHTKLGETSFRRSRKLKQLIDDGLITCAGNVRLKIYGMLNCSSGKRMKAENRIFFSTIEEALGNNYRPCGHCMREAYQQWKSGGHS
ncbi:metal-binding protein [Mucilaginibacter limnophilus]|uniref:Metal-binding protein n=1 Tax=Mucilaginibacter limnophilus TaxID=1932778 RepID=A0A437MQ88_9SPHI|nr:Ada metal-binding domain-containing protein [Mucilaginibacter limnophilus]RVT99810.1 metal-binding protein [Mucilaginibacter limnophilus]